MSCDFANLSESDEFVSDEEITDKQQIFVQKLKEHKIVLNKSQTPQVKVEKEAALTILAQQYEDIFYVPLTTKQLSKKISNMKTEIKKKFDMKKSGNKPIIYKPWEKLLLEILDVQKNPVFKKVPGAVSAGADEEVLLDKPRPSTSSDLAAKECSTIPRKKIKILNQLPETIETKILSTAELQRLVLLEQLKLCRMQQEEIRRRQQETDGSNVATENDRVYYNL